MRAVSTVALFLVFSLQTACHAAPSAKKETAIGNEIRDCADCPPLIKLPAAAFGERSLFVARHELTWAEYLPSVGEAGCALPKLPTGAKYPANLASLADNYPLTYLPPIDFSCYLAWLSKKTGFRYRLPSSAEWEFAARAGAKTRFPWGEDPGFNHAALYPWFDPSRLASPADVANDPRSSLGKDKSFFKVESFPPNRWGLYDVVGNVEEYTSDSKTGMPSCIQNVGEAKCKVAAVRGGRVESVGVQTRGGRAVTVGEDFDFLSRVNWVSQGFAQPPGYRIVRDADQ